MEALVQVWGGKRKIEESKNQKFSPVRKEFMIRHTVYFIHPVTILMATWKISFPEYLFRY